MRKEGAMSNVGHLLGRELRRRRRALLATGLFTIAVVAVAATPRLLGTQVSHAFEQFTDARPAWLWLAALLVVATIVAWAQAWRSAVGTVGGEVSRVDAVAWYSLGSAVNTFFPARLGDVLRIALFSRALDTRTRVWTTAGVYTTIGAARALTAGVLILAGFLSGTLPLWTVLASGALVVAAVVASVFARGRGPHSRIAHFFDAYRELGRHPRRAAPIVAWTIVATAARVAAAAAIVSSLGVPHALAVALLVIPTLDAASLLPVTPGGLSVSSGAVALALKGIGIGTTTALTVGIGYHAIEAAAAVVCGTIGALVLAGEQRPVARHAAVALTGLAVVVAVAGALGVGVNALDVA
jgi:uncharacterized membrane protein YbhN (UPF0104 family)